ncbi:DUF3158 family protein [Xanthomonas campestris pv. campestris]|nr:DUF3158 family protein [Xanthomonas campestris pv. campestris]
MIDQHLYQPTRFHPLEQTDFIRLEQAPYLKGLLKPFKGKGALDVWASQCVAQRDQLIVLAQRRVLQQAAGHPFHLLPVELAQQKTGAGTTFLRWRRPDRSAMGVALWQDLVLSDATPASLLADLYAIEQQRLVLNMQISLMHTLGRQALECANKMSQAESTFLHRVAGAKGTARYGMPPQA